MPSETVPSTQDWFQLYLKGVEAVEKTSHCIEGTAYYVQTVKPVIMYAGGQLSMEVAPL